ncbi:hypothetical protein [Nocardioides sp. cx-173]|uniref:hypothetical protein n=1 Tax=Nocardioides sp. cx-173 TaxID=2898796 RepID=UPI001E3EE54E|nr:hypothetical protein [Nocardioides sp. cx-173]MCD4526764.1 hypothetical protein [Nocardioides sp. cx-173]UGB43870.1 hypothetical protein LQ940_10215 [Nocardioides sp. cx-173]
MSLPSRPWTRIGILGMAGHLGYELAAGVGVPLAPRLGVGPAVLGYAASAGAAYVAAGRLRSPRGDQAFAAANGLFLAAVLGHYTSWPRTTRRGLPWLEECEGMRGPVMGPYNLLLQVSGVAAVAGLVETRRRWRWGAAACAVALPALRWATPREYAGLVQQAQGRPRWWNRRLAALA